MQKTILSAAFIVLYFPGIAFSQTDNAVYFKGAIKENRSRLQRNIIENIITGSLSLPLNNDTEEKWTDSLWALELTRYKSPWVEARIYYAFDSIENRSLAFQRDLLELAYTNYPHNFSKKVEWLSGNTADSKIHAMCAEYLFANGKYMPNGSLAKRKSIRPRNDKDEAIERQLLYHTANITNHGYRIPMTAIVSPAFLKDNIVLYSIQRKNRNYPGIVIIRDSAGNFIKDENGELFSVPQLARSISNLPGYLTNGNSPQGIYRMFGFAVSKSNFIGPSANIQLTLPFETSLRHFFGDSTITDTAWSEKWYEKLLPAALKNYQPLYESFYAGKAGRTEIIAHGTTVDPEYYKGEPYYPHTPTMGCLATVELWSASDGKRIESNQQKLVNALLKAGGAKGYCVVIEIDDTQMPVSLKEILPLFTRL